jgi:sRNA-binding regulator protein Hfq
MILTIIRKGRLKQYIINAFQLCNRVNSKYVTLFLPNGTCKDFDLKDVREFEISEERYEKA